MSTEVDRAHRQDEVDEEPAPAIEAAGHVQGLQRPATVPKEKRNLKLITLEPFNGEARDGHDDWSGTLKVQIELREH